MYLDEDVAVLALGEVVVAEVGPRDEEGVVEGQGLEVGDGLGVCMRRAWSVVGVKNPGGSGGREEEGEARDRIERAGTMYADTHHHLVERGGDALPERRGELGHAEEGDLVATTCFRVWMI